MTYRIPLALCLMGAFQAGSWALDDSMCREPGTECKGIFNSDTIKKPLTIPQDSLDPVPDFPEILPPDHWNNGILVECLTEDLTPTKPVKGNYVRGLVGCGEMFAEPINYWLRIGDPVRDPVPDIQTLKFTLSVDDEVGAKLFGGIITNKLKVGAQFEYTVVITTWHWTAYYSPVPIGSKQDLHPCGKPDRISSVMCVRDP